MPTPMHTWVIWKQLQLAGQYDEKGDQLQLVMLIMALGSPYRVGIITRPRSNMRLAFSLFGIIAFVAALFIYIFQVPTVIV